jgi:polar amino acid transport system permease protein
MEFNLFVLKQIWPLMLQGALITVIMCSVSLLLGAILGIFLCFGKMTGGGIFFRFSVIVIDIFRTLPEMVPIFWIYSCGPLVLNIKLSPEGSGILALTLYCAAFLAEIFRGGIQALPKGQFEASYALGIPTFWIWTMIVAPQAARIMFPPFINFMCDLVKVSSLLSMIGIMEISYRAVTLSGETYRYIEIFTFAGALYFMIIFPLSILARRRARAIARSQR